jgi:hypothetical protein
MRVKSNINLKTKCCTLVLFIKKSTENLNENVAMSAEITLHDFMVILAATN